MTQRQFKGLLQRQLKQNSSRLASLLGKKRINPLLERQMILSCGNEPDEMCCCTILCKTNYEFRKRETILKNSCWIYS